MKELNLKWFRTNFGVVSQEPVLFDMTISENIKLGESNDVTGVDIEAAAKAANAHDFIMKLPKVNSSYECVHIDILTTVKKSHI